MTAKAWHYSLPNGKSGTLVGEGIESEEQAREWIARQHRERQEDVNVKFAGGNEDD